MEVEWEGMRPLPGGEYLIGRFVNQLLEKYYLKLH